MIDNKVLCEMGEAEEERGAKWEGKAIAEVKGVEAEQVWGFVEDFCNLHKYFPSLATCLHVDGSPGQPGMIRYCASPPGDQDKVMWARERLVEVDPLRRWLRYEVVDNNMGFQSYVGTAEVTSSSDGSNIEWSFVCDPVDGLRLEDLLLYLHSSINFMAAYIMEHQITPN